MQQCERLHVGRGKRIIRPEQDIIKSDYIDEEPQRFGRMHDAVIGHVCGIGGRRLGRDVTLGSAIHAPMHDVETAGEIGVSASAVREHQLEAGKTVEHTGH